MQSVARIDSYGLFLELKETFVHQLPGERVALIHLIKDDKLCLELLMDSIRHNIYDMFVMLVELLPGDEQQKKRLIHAELKNNNYIVILTCFSQGWHWVLKENGPRLMEEIFEKYLIADDLKILANSKITHERFEIICMSSSRKLVQMLFAHMIIDRKKFLIQFSQFSSIRAASTNPNSNDLALFLLQELTGSISEEHRNELVKTVLHVSSKNDRVDIFKTVLAAESKCADDKSSQIKLYEHVSRDNFSLFIAASFAIRDAIIDMFSDNSIKQKLLVASIQWKFYLCGIFSVEYKHARADLISILQSSETDEKAMIATSGATEALIKHIQEGDNTPMFSEEERKFIDFIYNNFVSKLKPKENGVIDDFINKRIILIDPNVWTESQIKVFLPVIQQIRLIARETATRNVPLAELHELNLWLTHFFDEHSEVDYQFVRMRLPRLSPIEMEQDIRQLFAASSSQQLTAMKERIIWADSLDVLLESKTTKKTLYINGDTVHRELTQHLPESHGISTTNLIVAQMGFVVSHGKKYSGEAKLPSPGREYLSFAVKPAAEVMYVTEEPDRAQNQTTFYRGLERDVKKVNVLLDSNEMINQKQFNIAYKHSEQALFQFIESPEGIQYIINELKKLKIAAGHKIYAVVLDIHSTQQMCAHCKTRTIGVQNSQTDGFLFKLAVALKKENIHVSKRGLAMVTRVSAVEAFEKAKDYKNIRGATPDFDVNTALTVVPPKPLHTIMNEAGTQQLRRLIHKARAGFTADIQDEQESIAKFAAGQTVSAQNKEKMKSEYKATQPLSKLPDVKQLKGLHLIETPKKVNAVIYGGNVKKQTGMYTIFSSGSKKISASSSSSSSSLSASAATAAAVQPKKENAPPKLSAVSLMAGQSKKRNHAEAFKKDTAASTAAGVVFVKK